MRRLYNKHFKVGFIVALAIFAIANVIAYLVALRQWKPGSISFAPASLGPPRWGFPFSWDGNHFSYPKGLDLGFADGLVLNFLTISACAFIAGLLVRWARLER